MKRYISLVLALLMTLALCACGESPAAETPETSPESVPESAPEATGTPAPTPYAEPESFSAMAGSLQRDADGVLWSSIAPMEGVRDLYELLGEDVGYVYSFLAAEDGLYAAVKEYSRSMDPAALWVFDRETGEGTLLAENLSAACVFCLLGDDVFLYRGEENGLWSLNVSTGENRQILPEGSDLLAARDGLFYYTKTDGALYRNNSTLGAEEKLLDDCPSYWLCPGTDSMFTLAYAEEGTKPVLEYRGFDGALQTSENLPEDPGSIGSDGTYVYVPQPTRGEILVYALADGGQVKSIPLPGDTAQCLVLHADGESLWCQIMNGGVFKILCIPADGSEPRVLAENILP